MPTWRVTSIWSLDNKLQSTRVYWTCVGHEKLRVINARNTLVFGLAAPPGSPPVEWRVSDSPLAYEEAVATMERRAAAIAAGQAPELVWLLEHPPLYTAGTSANPRDIVDARFPFYQTRRGGQMTYHGPGQRVAYVMLDLKRRAPDVRRFVATL